MASLAYFNLSHPASAAYTESWMSDQDVKAYSRQVRQAPVATSRSSAAKPASKAPAAAAAAKARKVQHAGKAEPKQPVVAKPKVTRVARTGAVTVH